MLFQAVDFEERSRVEGGTSVWHIRLFGAVSFLFLFGFWCCFYDTLRNLFGVL